MCFFFSLVRNVLFFKHMFFERCQFSMDLYGNFQRRSFCFWCLGKVHSSLLMYIRSHLRIISSLLNPFWHILSLIRKILSHFIPFLVGFLQASLLKNHQKSFSWRNCTKSLWFAWLFYSNASETLREPLFRLNLVWYIVKNRQKTNLSIKCTSKNLILALRSKMSSYFIQLTKKNQNSSSEVKELIIIFRVKARQISLIFYDVQQINGKQSLPDVPICH